MFFLDEDIQSSQEEFIEEESPVYQKTSGMSTANKKRKSTRRASSGKK